MTPETTQAIKHSFISNISSLLPWVSNWNYFSEKWWFLLWQLWWLYHALNDNCPDIELTTHHPDSPSLIVKWPWDIMAYELSKTFGAKVQSNYINTNNSDRWWVMINAPISLKSEAHNIQGKKKVLQWVMDIIQSKDNKTKLELSRLLHNQLLWLSSANSLKHKKQGSSWSYHHTILTELCDILHDGVRSNITPEQSEFLQLSGMSNNPKRLLFNLLARSTRSSTRSLCKRIIHNLQSIRVEDLELLTASEKEQFILSELQNSMRSHIAAYNPEINRIYKELWFIDNQGNYKQKLWSLDTERIISTQRTIASIYNDKDRGWEFLEGYIQELMNEKWSESIQVAKIAYQGKSQQLFIRKEGSDYILHTHGWESLTTSSEESFSLLSNISNKEWLRFIEFSGSLYYLWPLLSGTLCIGSERWVRKSLCSYLEKFAQSKQKDLSQLISFIEKTRITADNATFGNHDNEWGIPVYTDNFTHKKLQYYLLLAQALWNNTKFTQAYFDQSIWYNLSEDAFSIIEKLVNIPTDIENRINTQLTKRKNATEKRFEDKLTSGIDFDKQQQIQEHKEKALANEAKLTTIVLSSLSRYTSKQASIEDVLILDYILQ